MRDINFFQQNEDGYPDFLRLEDIQSVSPQVKDYGEKTMPLLSPEEQHPTGLNLIIEYARIKDSQGKRSQWFMVGGEERQDASELYRTACAVCEQIYGNASYEYGKILKEFAEQLESRHQEKGRPENSRWNKSFAIGEDELSMESRYFYKNAFKCLQEIGLELSIEMAEIYIGLARLFKPRAAQYSHYREQDVSINEVFQNLMGAIEIYEVILGFDHPETADAYTKMALAYQENGNFYAASPWIRRGFSIFYKCFGPYDQITQNTYEYLKAIETNIDSGLEKVPYDELPGIIIDLER
mmetsp:Transcript_10433/g.10474  ORF Transcript_10433/g.10474 Transcript_10433/m.10474 type:complete len:297 (-) Transcript_10433:106-996(-)